jgi:hypothetical protein
MFAFQPFGRELHEFLTMAHAHQAEAVMSLELLDTIKQSKAESQSEWLRNSV